MEPDIWDVIVVGRGSASRYYLTTVDRSLFPNILVIGKKDSWAGERGTDESDPRAGLCSHISRRRAAGEDSRSSALYRLGACWVWIRKCKKRPWGVASVYHRAIHPLSTKVTCPIHGAKVTLP